MTEDFVTSSPHHLQTWQQAILDSADFIIVSTDINGVIQTLNAGALKQFGYTPEEIIGKVTPTIFHDPAEVEQRAQSLSTELGRVIEPGMETLVAKARLSMVDENIWTLIRKDQSRFAVCLSVTALRDDSGQLKGFLGIGKDVTAQQEAEAALQRLNTNLERLVEERTSQLKAAIETAEIASQVKSRFIANMSHEFRTPLHGIMGFSQLLLKDRRITPDQESSLIVIQRSSEHLLSLVNEVITLSKVEAGMLTYESKDVNLHHLCEGVEDLFSLQAVSKDIQLQIQLASDVPKYVRTDAKKLRQILINLLGNALKFTKRGNVGCQVQWRPSESESPSSELCFTIQDTGPGIPSHLLPQLFTPFAQDPLTCETFGGIGLGLTLCQRFIQLMKGDIAIESVEGQGTTVSFHIPVELGEPVLEPTVSEATVAGLAGPTLPYRILVVEDYPDNREILLMMLEAVGFEVKEAENGQEAVDINRTWQPHLIWMDLQLPLLNGLEATKIIKDQDPNPPVIIAITAQALESDEVKALKAGCDDYLRKPYQATQVFDKMAQHLDITYRYETLNPSRTSEPVSLTTDALANMPSSWIQLLYDAAIMLDEDMLNLLLRDIPDDQNSLKSSLEYLMNTYQYDVIMEKAQAILK